MEPSSKVRISREDVVRLDEVRAILQTEKKVIYTKIDTISILIDEFLKNRNK